MSDDEVNGEYRTENANKAGLQLKIYRGEMIITKEKSPRCKRCSLLAVDGSLTIKED